MPIKAVSDIVLGWLTLLFASCFVSLLCAILVDQLDLKQNSVARLAGNRPKLAGFLGSGRFLAGFIS
uniref:Uncharacterized protein n=1 Tax=Romanomermis culicivorax TaxID=13658 RepID=A0A915L2L5_ROMCU